MSTALALNFEGNPINILMTTENEPRWLAKEVSTSLGYANPRQLADNIRRKWADELDENIDYINASRKVLKSLKCANPTHLDFSPRGELVLTEQGLFGVINLAKTDMGRRFRKWLRSDVLPSIARTGEYKVGQQEMFDTPNLDPKEQRRQLDAASRAKNAEARVRREALREKRIEAEMQLEAMRIEMEVGLQTREAKFKAAMAALGPDAPPMMRIAALGWAMDEDVSALKFAAGFEVLRGPQPPAQTAPANPATVASSLVVDYSDWKTPTAIAKMIGIPAINAIKVGGVVHDLGLKTPQYARSVTYGKYTGYEYSPEAVKRIIAHIKGE